MSLIQAANKERPILLTGEYGTNKSEIANELLGSPLVVYASDVEEYDYGSVPLDKGILIEDLHYKPNKQEILSILRSYGGKIVLTTDKQKNVPKEIKNLCSIKRAGKVNVLRNNIDSMSAWGDAPQSMECDIFTLLMEYLRNPNRDFMLKKLLKNKPPDTQIMTWLVENIHPNKLLFIDGRVRRRWPNKYFYELLAYAHAGNHFGTPKIPKRGSYSKIPKICLRLGLKRNEGYLLKQLLQDPTFVSWAKTQLDNSECRILGIGEKKRRRKTDPIIPNKNTTLDRWL